jgi:hypothetical protein
METERRQVEFMLTDLDQSSLTGRSAKNAYHPALKCGATIFGSLRGHFSITESKRHTSPLYLRPPTILPFLSRPKGRNSRSEELGRGRWETARPKGRQNLARRLAHLPRAGAFKRLNRILGRSKSGWNRARVYKASSESYPPKGFIKPQPFH